MKTILATFAASLVTTAVYAADQAYVDSSTASYNWSGIYAGVHVGYAGANYSGIDDSADILPRQGFPATLDLDGIAGGVQVGYNWQYSNYVFGIEGDITFGDQRDTVLDGDGNISGSIDFFGTLRGRAGYAMDNFMVYGTGGLAFARADYSAAFTLFPLPGAAGTISLNDVGYAVGGGVEWGYNENISFKLEGLYMGFDKSLSTAALTADSDAGDFVEFEDIIVGRIGINYRW